MIKFYAIEMESDGPVIRHLSAQRMMTNAFKKAYERKETEELHKTIERRRVAMELMPQYINASRQDIEAIICGDYLVDNDVYVHVEIDNAGASNFCPKLHLAMRNRITQKIEELRASQSAFLKQENGFFVIATWEAEDHWIGFSFGFPSKLDQAFVTFELMKAEESYVDRFIESASKIGLKERAIGIVERWRYTNRMNEKTKEGSHACND